MIKPRKLHILHIVSGDLWAGAEVQLFTLAKALYHYTPAALSVVILNRGKLEQELCKTGIRVMVLDESELNTFQLLRQLGRIVRELRPDVIHTHRTKENILGSITARLGGDIPSIRTAHGAQEHRHDWYNIPKQTIRFLDWFTGRYMQHRIIAVSEDLAGTLAQTFPPAKIRVIENGIDAESLSQSLTLTETKPPLKEPILKIGIVGRLVHVKRIDLFIQTARLLHDHYPDLKVSFHIFGDGPLREDLETLSRSLDTSRFVHFEGYCENITREILTLDILMMTSDHEGLPMVLLEAMALQTSIIAHKVGGIPNLLGNGTCGVLVDKHTPSGYAKAIYRLTTNPDNRYKLVKNAYVRVKSRYSSGENALSYYEQYTELVNLE